MPTLRSNNTIDFQPHSRLLAAAVFLTAMLFGLAAFFALPSDASAATLRTPPNNLGLVGYWSFEDGSGSTATDFSGSGNDGSLTNMDPATDWVSGRLGTALDFDGSDDYADSEDLSFFGGREKYSVSAWIKPDNVSSGDCEDKSTGGDIVSQGGTTNGENDTFYFHVCEDSRVGLYLDGKSLGLKSGAGTIDDNRWHFVTVTSNSSKARLYIDGEEVSSVSSSAAQDSIASVEIGGENDHGSHYDGVLDEVRIYDRALSSSEVKDLYNAGGYAERNATQDALFEDKLVSHWTMDGPDISGTTVNDVHGANDGTKNGSPVQGVGRVGQALEFDGNDDEVTIPGSDAPNPSKITVSAWVKSANSSGYDNPWNWVSKYNAYILSNDDNGLDKEVCFIIHDGTWRPDNYGDGPGCYTVDTPDQWHHMTGTYDGSTIKLYVDGDLKDSNSYSGAIDSDSGPLDIAHRERRSQGTDHFPGKIDDVRIYDAALSADEISRLYTATKPDTVNSSQNNKLTDGLVGMGALMGRT